jgi:hypothetical protein
MKVLVSLRVQIIQLSAKMQTENVKRVKRVEGGKGK